MGDAGTRDRLLAAACDLFAERGFRGVSVRDVAAAASVNVAAVNYYFGTKHKLWDEAYAALAQQAVSVASTALEPGAPASDNIARIMGALFDWIAEDARTLRMSVWASLSRDDQLIQTGALLRPLFVLFRSLIGDESSGRDDLELDLCAAHSMFSQLLMWRGIHRELLDHDQSDEAFTQRLRGYVIRTTLELLGLAA